MAYPNGNPAPTYDPPQPSDTLPLAPAGYVYAWDPQANSGDGGYVLVADRAPSSGSASSGPAWANVGLRGQELNQAQAQFDARQAQDAHQFDLQYGLNQSRQALDEATQKWREAIDARDFKAAEYWKARAQELQQNRLALDYTSLLASKSGPHDWITYGRLSRQESPLGTPDGKTVPLDQALPSWARGMSPGSYPDSSGNKATSFFGAAPASATPAAAGRAGQILDLPKSTIAKPAWAQTPQGFANQGGVVDNGDPNAQWALGDNGVAIKLSDWAVKNLQGGLR